jgi:hypothetical protein
VFHIVDFSSVNDLKFTYVHLQFQNFFRGLYPQTHIIKGREGKRRGEEGKGGKGREGRGWDEPLPKTNPVYGPASSSCRNKVKKCATWELLKNFELIK